MTLQQLIHKIAGMWVGSFVLFFCLPYPAIAHPLTPAQSAQRLPRPPRTPPVNDTRPGGGLDPDGDSCNNLNENLRALIPVENPVLTATAYPTFLFYIPAGAEAVQYGEFSLLPWPGETTRHYQTQFTLPESPGIVSIIIPELSAYELAENQTYRWYFQLYCRKEDGTQPDLITLRGAVQRVAITPERTQQIQAASPEIWYDALARVAYQLHAFPQDIHLQNQWRKLLQTIQAEELVHVDFLGPVAPY